MNKTLTPFNSLKVTLVAGAVTIGALTFAYKPEAASTPALHNPIPAFTSVAAMDLSGENTGTAVIRLDDFTLDVSFDFEAVEDSYGVPGSEFYAVEITQLSIDHITDKYGNTFPDFTDQNDHRNINLLLSTFIEKNNLVEA
ncbi:hypothetical protein LDO52_07660 [Acinetobacter pseudolwoffii]|uniref:hypothetical protein n=1 Tax=Acinetobacter pseudolwoffii TaxID=2053287 RepID=UPI001CE226C9|nr:hypothetical protein [Acinetobacter pseudolwoffii]UBX51247.1 hypothetical protein LDO52_07660 [Acinetobacter pseudolwoffii]